MILFALNIYYLLAACVMASIVLLTSIVGPAFLFAQLGIGLILAYLLFNKIIAIQFKYQKIKDGVQTNHLDNFFFFEEFKKPQVFKSEKVESFYIFSRPFSTPIILINSKFLTKIKGENAVNLFVDLFRYSYSLESYLLSLLHCFYTFTNLPVFCIGYFMNKLAKLFPIGRDNIRKIKTVSDFFLFPLHGPRELLLKSNLKFNSLKKKYRMYAH